MIHRIAVEQDVLIKVDEQVAKNPKELDSIRQTSFTQILHDRMKVDEVSFSAHALTRLEQRNISIDEQIKAQLEGAIEKIALKGGKESLIMLDSVAYLVSIPNKKVITALDTFADNVFTNIDSAFVMCETRKQ
jgi:flagellar operon protein